MKLSVQQWPGTRNDFGDENPAEMASNITTYLNLPTLNLLVFLDTAGLNEENVCFSTQKVVRCSALYRNRH